MIGKTIYQGNQPDRLRWRESPKFFNLKRNQVHLWLAPARLSEEKVECLGDFLSQEERSRVARFHFEKDRSRALISRGALRDILSRYVGINPKKIEFSYNPYGKPALKPSNAQKKIGFSVSHAGDYIIYSISQDEVVGIDLEYMDPKFSSQEIAEQFFSSSEIAVFQSLPENLKTEAFFNCWTRKEAFIKAIGEGLSCPLKDFDVTLRPGELAKLLEIRRPSAIASEWSLYDIEVGEGYKAALAAKGPVNQLESYRYV